MRVNSCDQFDLVNSQFCFHYFFESEARVRGVFRNVSERLKPGGYFLGTIPDANWIM